MNCPLRQFYNESYRPRRLATAAPGTLRNYEWCFRFFSRFLGRESLVDDLRDETIGAYLAWRAKAVAPATANKDYHILVAIAKYAARKRLLEEPPELRPLREYNRAPTAWSPAEVERLLKAAQAMPEPAWWRAFLLVAIDTGLRRQALFALTWEHVDFQRGTVLARAEDSKTGRDELIGVSRETLEALAAIRRDAQADETVFRWDRHWTRYYQLFHDLLVRAGLPNTRRDKTQRLRRTSGTLAELVGGPGAGQKHLGHTSGAMTARHYLDPSLLPGNDVARRFPHRDRDDVFTVVVF